MFSFAPQQKVELQEDIKSVANYLETITAIYTPKGEETKVVEMYGRLMSELDNLREDVKKL